MIGGFICLVFNFNLVVAINASIEIATIPFDLNALLEITSSNKSMLEVIIMSSWWACSVSNMLLHFFLQPYQPYKGLNSGERVRDSELPPDEILVGVSKGMSEF